MSCTSYQRYMQIMPSCALRGRLGCWTFIQQRLQCFPHAGTMEAWYHLQIRLDVTRAHDHLCFALQVGLAGHKHLRPLASQPYHPPHAGPGSMEKFDGGTFPGQVWTCTAEHDATQLSLCPALQVGLLDIDICGPSIPRMLGLEGEEIHSSAGGWSPVYVTDNLGVMSIGFLLPDKDDAVIWRGPRKNGLIKQFLKVGG